jgi:hypothetical protein
VTGLLGTAGAMGHAVASDLALWEKPLWSIIAYESTMSYRCASAWAES